MSQSTSPYTRIDEKTGFVYLTADPFAPSETKVTDEVNNVTAVFSRTQKGEVQPTEEEPKTYTLCEDMIEKPGFSHVTVEKFPSSEISVDYNFYGVANVRKF